MKIIEIHCCFDCPYCSCDIPGKDAICRPTKKAVEGKVEVCPPSWCPLPDVSNEPFYSDTKVLCRYAHSEMVKDNYKFCIYCGEPLCKSMSAI